MPQARSGQDWPRRRGSRAAARAARGRRGRLLAGSRGSRGRRRRQALWPGVEPGRVPGAVLFGGGGPRACRARVCRCMCMRETLGDMVPPRKRFCEASKFFKSSDSAFSFATHLHPPYVHLQMPPDPGSRHAIRCATRPIRIERIRTAKAPESNNLGKSPASGGTLPAKARSCWRPTPPPERSRLLGLRIRSRRARMQEAEPTRPSAVTLIPLTHTHAACPEKRTVCREPSQNKCVPCKARGSYLFRRGHGCQFYSSEHICRSEQNGGVCTQTRKGASGQGGRKMIPRGRQNNKARSLNNSTSTRAFAREKVRDWALRPSRRPTPCGTFRTAHFKQITNNTNTTIQQQS